MKNVFKSIFFLLPVLSACSSVPYDENLRYQIIRDFSMDIKKKKDMTLIGLGGGQQGRLFCFTYTTKKNLNLEQARELLVDTCEDFLKRVNNDKKLRPYMVEYPYNGKNIDIMIQFVDSNNDRAQPPYMALAANFQGKVCYFTSNLQEQLVDFHEESYEETCKIVRDSH